MLGSCEQAQRKDIDSEIKKDSTKEILTIPKDENKDREIWQKPELVISMMGDLSGKTVADIGAGTGYFTFRLALQANKVLAIDIEKSYLEILDNLKQKLPSEIQDKIETRIAKEDNPQLKDEEVDLIVIINTLNVIDNKLDYLKTLKQGLKKGGKLFIIDFKMKNIPIDAPDINDRLPIYDLEKDLNKAGFKNIRTDDTTLDYQYIVVAEK
ncbi:MAG: class I SAM-dependent methyltransferase [Saprospiraceae bacterium]